MHIIQNMENNEKNSNQECLNFYKDSNRGGIMLDRFLSGYSSYNLCNSKLKI